jgi:hypothetical protein
MSIASRKSAVDVFAAMRLVGHQPEFLPWLGFFHKLTLGDIYMIVDNVQFKKKHFENRNRIRSRDGALWITVPVQTQGRFEQHIDEVVIDDRNNWRHKILKSIELNYSKTPHFSSYWPFFKQCLEQDRRMLAELNEELIRGCIEFLGIEVEIVKSSELGVDAKGTDLIVEMCKVVGADVYVSGQSGKEYLDEADVAAEGIGLVYQDFEHPQYRQVAEPFIPQLSVVDLLFNEGGKAGEYVRSAGTFAES